jgi:DNA-directed RNA polymerase beta' subunit
MAQNVLAETELKHLAAIPYQLVSPAANSPIIGIFQDSLLGSYRFTRSNIKLSKREAMNILMMFKNIDVNKILEKKEELTSFDILSQILPPITMKFKTKLYEDSESTEYNNNNILEIRNGDYLRGQIEKSVLGGSTKGIIHRIFNDFGYMAASNFIDDLQNIITEYMKTSSFSVGISDLVSDRKTSSQIIQIINDQKMEVQSLIEKIHLGIFKNETASSNSVEFEARVTNLLNKATDKAGKIGRASLSKNNRFVMIVNSGSKGSPINISQMISCVGQQSPEGKRIPYGFDSRTLPHYSKFDDSPNSRGFVENSYISGLTAPELFFHAMGGRIGLIDTAIKSVTKDTKIIVIENDKCIYTEIGTWIDDKLDSNKELVKHYPEDRNMELLDVDGIYIPSTDEHGNVEWRNISAVTRHDSGNKLFKVTTKSGRTVTVPESKSLLIWNKNDERFEERLTEEITIGDMMPVTEFLQLPSNKKYINDIDMDNIYEYIPPNAFISENSIVKEILCRIFSRYDMMKSNFLSINSSSETYIEGVSILCSQIGVFGSLYYDKNNMKYVYEIHGKWYNKFMKEVVSNTYEIYNVQDELYNTINNVVLDPIVQIEHVDVKDHPKLYDLTVPSTKNFGLANGLHVYDTSQTGYIQRRLIKGLEDLKVEYDMTVRNSKGKIVQFKYGDDGFDTTRVESQGIPLVEMSIEDIYMHYDIIGLNDYDSDLLSIYSKGTITRMKKQRVQTKEMSKKYIDEMIKNRDILVEKIFKQKNENSVKIPVAFQSIITNIQGQLNLNSNSIVDITPLEAFQLIEEYFEKLSKLQFVPPTKLFEIMYFFYLSPRDLLTNKRFHQRALVLLLETILLKYKQAIVHPGEMVGVIAGQSIGEPTTQLSVLRSESLKIIRVNKTTKIPEMMSGEIGIICDKLITDLPEYTFETEHKDSVETLLEPLDDEYYIVGVDEKERTHWNKISHVSRHIVNGDMIRVKTRSGREVVTTMSHSHLIRKDQTVQPILGKDMEIGMRIPVAKYIENSFIKDSIEIAGKSYELDYLFGWFIGAYLAEGCLVKKKGKMEAIGTISISNVSEYYIENTKKFASRFNRNCTVKSKTNQIIDSEKTYTNTDTLFTFKPLADLIMNTCSTGSFAKRVPDFAFLAPDEFKSGLISGYMDGDGNFMCDKLHHQIRVCSRSKQLIKDISLLFAYFNIFGSLHKSYRNGDNYYHLAISPKYAKIYQEKIGSNLHNEKLQSLVNYTERSDIISLREDIDRINGLGEIIAKCGKTLELSGQSRLYGRWSKKDSIGRSTLQKYIEIFESHEKSNLIEYELSILRQAVYSNVVWDEIIEIEKYTPDQTEYVYDFTVPGNQTFMTDNGVIVHNTLNSVTFETEILVKDKNGIVSKVQIGEFTKENIKTSSKIDYMEDKDTTYAELSEYYEVPSASEDGHTVWRRIEAVTQHPVINTDGTNTMLKITTKGNREATVTKAKSLLQLVDGKIQQVEGSSVKVGDYLPFSRIINSIDTSIEKAKFIPNILNGNLVLEPRDERIPDLEFDQIVSIEEVSNTTNYAYDLTVEDTRNFDIYNGLCLADTFHLAGVASKSNVTRGVPRIEEILRLTKNPKNPSLTVHLKPFDETEQEKAQKFANIMEHTKLIDLVKNIQICFDPNDKASNILEDRLLLEQFYEFESMVEECLETDNTELNVPQKSKWIVRMEVDPEILLDKNITMDDIHFAIKNSNFGNEISCVYSDYNMDKLIFRIRTNSNIFSKTKKRGVTESLDQSDEIYLLRNFQDTLLNNIVLRGISGIENVLPRKLQNMVVKEDGKYIKKDVWILDTTGTNLLDTLALDFIDYKRTYSNDIKEIFNVLGIEAARQVLYNEFVEVMEFSDVYINYHHLSLLCDRMTSTKDMVSIFRSGILNDDIGPISKSTFEVHTEVLLNAARHAEFDHMRGVSSTVMMGQYGYYGTNAFNLVLDMKEMEELDSVNVDVSDKNDEIDKMFRLVETDIGDKCARSNIEIKNNIENIKRQNTGICEDDYNMGF